jgi:hypothetical protein
MIRMFLSRTYLLSSIHFWGSFEALHQMQLFLNTPKLNLFSQWRQSDSCSLIHGMHHVRQDQSHSFETPRRVWSGRVPANNPAWTLIAKTVSLARQEATTSASAETVVRGQLLSHEGDYVCTNIITRYPNGETSCSVRKGGRKIQTGVGTT